MVQSGDATEPGTGGSGVRPWAEAQVGDTVGRYELREILGKGAMGIVFAAWDPLLDRDVALKVVGTGGSDRLRQSLQREARTLAQVSDPHVVPVLDVGTVEERDALYIAMELVRGPTLRDWLAQAPRPWPEVVEVFLGAGQGLAAAHRAGVVHRDFKPSNVLVGADGRARVTDFGVARMLDDTSAGGTGSGPRAADGSSAAMLLRATAGAGTPAYMAPEQHAGDRIDARADQFAFCVALWEALFGELPFAGAAPAAVMTNVAEGRIRKPPRGTSVPGRIMMALQRGLSRRPADRYATMTDLLAALPIGGRRRATFVVAVGAAVLAGALAVGLHDDDPCTEAADAVSAVWSEPSRRSVEEGLAAVDVPAAVEANPRIVGRLDEYAGRLADAHATACRNTASEAVGLCLAHARRALAGNIAVFTTADAKALARADASLDGLPDVDRCFTDPGSQPGPSEEAARADIEPLRAALARARVVADMGGADVAARSTGAVLAEAWRLGDEAFATEALLAHGHHLRRAGQWSAAGERLRDAFFGAQALGLDGVAADAACELVELYTDNISDLDEARRWADHAETALRRTGDPARERRQLAALAQLRREEGRYDEARELLEAVLQSTERDVGPDSRAAAVARQQLARVARVLNDGEEAEEQLDAAEAILVRVAGPDHPDVAHVLMQRARLWFVTGREEDAAKALERAAEIRRRWFATDSLEVAEVLLVLAHVQRERGELEASEAGFRRVIRIIETHAGPDHDVLGDALSGLAGTLAKAGDVAGALPPMRRSLEIMRTKLGPTHTDYAVSLTNYGMLLAQSGDTRGGVEALREAIPIFEAALGADHPYAASTRQHLEALESGTGT